jgi:hypothetical protein
MSMPRKDEAVLATYQEILPKLKQPQWSIPGFMHTSLRVTAVFSGLESSVVLVLGLDGWDAAQAVHQPGRVVVMRVILSSAAGSRSGVVESAEEAVEDFLTPDLPLGGGVVTLLLQSGAELDGGDEEAAGFTDGLEVTAHLDRSCAVAVAEHPLVHLVAQLAHPRPSSSLASWLG